MSDRIEVLLKAYSSDSGFLFEAAYGIAQNAHKHQKRNKGKVGAELTPYMSHIDYVILATYDGVKFDYEHIIIDLFLCVAALHDVFEDHPDQYPLERIKWLLADSVKSETINYSTIINNILKAVEAISKKPKSENEPYDIYCDRVKENTWARRVKRADLEHNMSDLEPGNLLAKYQLTLAYLKL